MRADPVNYCSSHSSNQMVCTVPRYGASEAAITDSSNTLQGCHDAEASYLLPLLLTAKCSAPAGGVRASACSDTFRAGSNLVCDSALPRSCQKLSPLLL